jgi:hypothetical protein
VAPAQQGIHERLKSFQWSAPLVLVGLSFAFMTALSFRSVFPEISPLYSTLKSAVKTQANMIAILCDPRRGGNALENLQSLRIEQFDGRSWELRPDAPYTGIWKDRS